MSDLAELCKSILTDAAYRLREDMATARLQGLSAGFRGEPCSANPHALESVEGREWHEAWSETRAPLRPLEDDGEMLNERERAARREQEEIRRG